MDKVSRVGGVASPEVLKVLEWVKKSQIVEEWHEGANFFRKYASGFIEQGGVITFASAGSVVKTITFHKEFEVAPASIACTIGRNTGTSYNAAEYPLGIFSYSNTKFSCAAYNQGGSSTALFWIACGY